MCGMWGACVCDYVCFKYSSYNWLEKNSQLEIFKSYSNIPYSHIPINYMKSQLLMDTNCCRGKPVGHTHPWLTPHGYTVMTALTLN